MHWHACLDRQTQPGRHWDGREKLYLEHHLDPEAVMISTPLDKYEGDVCELAEGRARETGLDYSKKKNRVFFPKEEKLIQLLGIKE